MGLNASIWVLDWAWHSFYPSWWGVFLGTNLPITQIFQGFSSLCLSSIWKTIKKNFRLGSGMLGKCCLILLKDWLFVCRISNPLGATEDG